MKKKWFACCLSIVIAPLLLCGFYYGAVNLYIAFTDLPYDNEVIDAYALLPAEATGAAILTDLRLREDHRLESIFPYHAPHAYIDRLFASAGFQFEDVSQVALLSVDYNSAGMLIYTQQAQAGFDRLQAQGAGQLDTYEENPMFVITSPHAEGYGDDADNYNLEPWAWALIDDGLLIVDGISTVENIFDIYHGRRANLVEARPVMKTIITLMRDKPNVYFSFRREEDIAKGKIFVWIVRFFMGPLYGLVEMSSLQAGSFAAEEVDGWCISTMGSQMPSRKSAVIMSSMFGALTGFDNMKPPDLRSWNADLIETVRINNVMLTKVYWQKEKCDKIRAEKPPFVFPD